MAGLVHPRVGIGSLCHILDSVLGVGEVALDPVVELTPPFFPAEDEFEAPVGHTAHVDGRGVPGRDSEGDRNHSESRKDVASLLAKPVSGEVETVGEELKFEPGAHLFGLLPCDVFVAESAFRGSVVDSIVRARGGSELVVVALERAGTGSASETAGAHVDRVGTGEVKIALAADLVVAHETVAGAQLDEGQNVVLGEERFVGNDIARRCRREEAEAPVLGEVLSAVVGKVELEHVAGVVVVGKAGRGADKAARGVEAIVGHGVFGRPAEEQTAYVVFAEVALVVEDDVGVEVAHAAP